MCRAITAVGVSPEVFIQTCIVSSSHFTSVEIHGEVQVAQFSILHSVLTDKVTPLLLLIAVMSLRDLNLSLTQRCMYSAMLLGGKHALCMMT